MATVRQATQVNSLKRRSSTLHTKIPIEFNFGLIARQRSKKYEALEWQKKGLEGAKIRKTLELV